MKTGIRSFRIKLALIIIVALSCSCASNRPSSAFELQKSYFQGSSSTPKGGYCGGRCDR